jgi:hypothetical protein
MRRISLAALALIVAAPLFAQQPKGWKMRVDRSTSAQDPDGSGEIKFVTSGSGFHATNPQAAVYWTPTNTATGTYTLKGKFTLMKPSGHANYYGLIFGGSDLEGPQQQYLYFVVAQNGMWLIKRRNGDASTENIQARTPSDAIKKPGDDGKSVNDLEVRVGAYKFDYLIKGQVFNSTPNTGNTAKTDGIYGIRVNHLLEVQIDGLAVSK